MREIKFRAWYVTDGRMITVDYNGGYAKVKSLSELFRMAEINTYKLMQYTGLKDKNGTDVYEGDLLKWTFCSYHDNHLHSGEPSVVEWKDSGFNLEPITCDSYEVVGNIYENPELLKETN